MPDNYLSYKFYNSKYLLFSSLTEFGFSLSLLEMLPDFPC